MNDNNNDYNLGDTRIRSLASRPTDAFVHGAIRRPRCEASLHMDPLELTSRGAAKEGGKEIRFQGNRAIKEAVLKELRRGRDYGCPGDNLVPVNTASVRGWINLRPWRIQRRKLLFLGFELATFDPDWASK